MQQFRISSGNKFFRSSEAKLYCEGEVITVPDLDSPEFKAEFGCNEKSKVWDEMGAAAPPAPDLRAFYRGDKPPKAVPAASHSRSDLEAQSFADVQRETSKMDEAGAAKASGKPQGAAR